MNGIQTWDTIFEICLCILIIVGIKYEPDLTAWEEKTFYKILDKFKRGK